MAIINVTVQTGLGVRPTTTGYVSPIQVAVRSSFSAGPSLVVRAIRVYQVTVSAGLGLRPIAAAADLKVYNVSVTAGLGLRPALALAPVRVYAVAVSAGLGLRPTALATRLAVYSVTVSAGLGLRPTTAAARTAVRNLTLTTGLGLRPVVTPNIVKAISVSVGLGLRPFPAMATVRSFSVTAGLGLRPSAASGREFVLAVSAGLGMRPGAVPVGSFPSANVTAGLGLRALAAAVLGGTEVSSGLILSDSVACEVLVAAGVGLPGVSPQGGPTTVLMRGLSGSYPLSFAETPSGTILMANGVDPMLRWDGASGQADVAGVLPPAAAPTLTPTGLGLITGIRYGFCRFVDVLGNPSNLSPISGGVNCGSDRSIDGVTLNATSGLVTIRSVSHGLSGGATILLRGITGLPLSGFATISVIDADHFSLRNVSLARGNWTGGGSWTNGCASIDYSNIPQSTQMKVASIQLLRNLEGNLDVLYVDATITPGTTFAASTLGDEELARREAVPLRSADGWPLALRHGVPPSNRPFLASYQGRIFAAGDASYYAGCVAVTNGSRTIRGVGTQWPTSFAGRMISIKGASTRYGITSVNADTQELSLDRPYGDPTSAFSTYWIRSGPGDRKTLQWSEPDNPEAWPAWSGLAIPEDGDEITGLFVKGTYLYVAERRHLYRFQFSGDPGQTGHVFLAAERGTINHRLIVQADDAAYLMDESGVYAFDGQAPRPISGPVQVLFQADFLAPTFSLDWAQDTTLWHAAVDPSRTMIRWFVSMVGEPRLTVALCYNYRLDRWWTEQYPTAITSSCTGTIAEAPNVAVPSGHRRALAGTECRMVLALGEGSLDLAAAVGTLRGRVTSADEISLTDAAASFAPYLAGAPVAIVSGKGEGQTRLISQSSATNLVVVKAWTTAPDSSSTYQIGGVPWQWRSGHLDAANMEAETVRDLIVAYQALTHPSQLSVQLFPDHAPTPTAWALDRAQDGVVAIAGEPHVRFEMSDKSIIPGWRYFRMSEHSDRYGYGGRYVQLLLSGVSNDEIVRVYNVTLRGVDQEGL